MISNISIKDLLPKLNQLNIIDIRNIESYNNNHIPNAINIPQNKLLLEPHKYLNPNQTYYIYCQKGLSSAKVCNNLRSKGYKVINIIGGYESWILEK